MCRIIFAGQFSCEKHNEVLDMKVMADVPSLKAEKILTDSNYQVKF